MDAGGRMEGERLRLARAQAGLSLRGLASRMGGLVTAQALGKYERGEMTPSPGVLLALAEALGVGVADLSEPLEVALDGIEFRKLTGTTKRDRMRVEAEVLHRVEAYLLVEDLLGLDGGTWANPLSDQAWVTDPVQAEDLATRVRHSWRLGHDPIPSMTELLEERGIKVLVLQLPEGVSGLTCMVRRPGNLPPVPAVVANRSATLERRRLTLAHELAHLLLNPTSPVDLERTANRFAGAFLAPREHLLGEIGSERRVLSYRELIDLKRRYGISGAALLVRLRDLEIITPAMLSHAFQTFARGWRRKEPEPIEDDRCRGELEAARRFERLLHRAVAEGLIPLTRAAELLGQSRDHLEAELRGSARIAQRG